MADFGYFSDTDDSAVEELLSQAKELSALEQVAAINCSGFTDSTLPDDLESRFRRLKSLPAPRPDPVSSSSNRNKQHLTHLKSVVTHPKEVGNFSKNRRNPGKKSASVSLSDEDSSIFSGKKRDLDLKSGIEKGSKAELDSNGSGDFSDSVNESKIFSPVKQTKKLPKEKRRIVSSSSSLSSIDLATPPLSDSEPEKRSKSKSKSKSSSSSWFEKLSPAKIIGSIWRSPKKSSTNKKSLKSSKSFNTAAYSSGRERNIDFDEFLSDLNAFSVEDQRKMLKKALKEQQKMRKEAAEIIKMTKKASVKLDFDD